MNDAFVDTHDIGLLDAYSQAVITTLADTRAGVVSLRLQNTRATRHGRAGGSTGLRVAAAPAFCSRPMVIC